MEAYEGLLSRRSIRKFTGEPIPEVLIDKVLKAAFAAPSAGNQQPWHFLVIKDQVSHRRIMGFHPFSQMLEEAGTAILVCGELALQKFEGYWIQDCSNAAENMLLAAHYLGLGAVWLGIHPVEDRVRGIVELFSLPEGILPLCLIVLGYPGEEKPPSDRYDAGRIHREKW